jgi:hypothetical protein
MPEAWRRLDFVWRVTTLWLSAIGATVVVGFAALKLVPSVSGVTWSVGIITNLLMAVACGACLAWYRRCAPVPWVAMLGAVTVTLSLDLLAGPAQVSLTPAAGVGALLAGTVPFNLLSTAVGCIGMVILFLLGAPIGLVARRIRPPR